MCYNPMVAEIKPFVNPETGKRVVKFCGSLKKFLAIDPNVEMIIRNTGQCHIISSDLSIPDVEPYFKYDPSTGEYLGREYRFPATILPCGQCLECRCKYAQSWADRIMLESQYHEKSYFITLTYDEEHIPRSHDSFGAEVFTLEPKHLQDFLKRLRRDQEYHKDNKIRFYAVGEYGSIRHRPHYHLIVFGLVLDDIEVVGRSKHGSVLHDSLRIRKLWSMGITEVDQMTWETAAYCARYTTKKLGKTESDFYSEHGLVPEFTRMSLKPAIGWQYFIDHSEDFYNNDEIFISTSKGGRKIKPPRYYDQKYDDIYPDQMAEVKENRKDVAEKALVARLDRFDGSYLDLLYQYENKFKQRNKILRRNLE